MRQCHSKDISIYLPFIKGDLGVVFKKSHQHTVVGTALTFQMVFFGFFSFYFKTGICNPFFLVPTLLVQKVFIWRESDFFLP